MSAVLHEYQSGPGRRGAPDPALDEGVLRDDLLRRVESQIDFPAWLIAQKFHISPVQRDLTRIAFANQHGDTIYLRKDVETRSWSYETVSDPPRRGTLLDLVQQDGATRAQCLERLARCLDPSNRGAEPAAYRAALADPDQTLTRAVGRHVEAATAERVAERDLESLGVPPGTFDRWRFGSATTVLRDPPDIGHSRYRPSDREIVVLERPIDAVAYERVHGHQHATYIYTGDRPSDETKRKLAHVLADAPAGVRIIAAFGRDSRGARLAEELAELAPRRLIERRAPGFGSRWSDQMQIEHRHSRSLERLHRRPDPVLEAVRQHIGRALDAGVDQAAIRTTIVSRPSHKRGRGLDR